jgi:hypothetical protein
VADNRVLMNFEINESERALLKKHAKAEGKSVAKYLRGCYLADMMMAGDVQAAKIFLHDLGRLAREKWEGFCPPEKVARLLFDDGRVKKSA